MSANETQIGGDHYRSSVQHWDLITRNAIGYLEGNATKYLSRWRKKNGRQDLEKTLHYIEKMLELAHTTQWYEPTGVAPTSELSLFFGANVFDTLTKSAIIGVLQWDRTEPGMERLQRSRDIVAHMLDNYDKIA